MYSLNIHICQQKESEKKIHWGKTFLCFPFSLVFFIRQQSGMFSTPHDTENALGAMRRAKLAKWPAHVFPLSRTQKFSLERGAKKPKKNSSQLGGAFAMRFGQSITKCLGAIYSLFNLEFAKKEQTWLMTSLFLWRALYWKKWDANEHQNARLVSITVPQFLNSTTSDVSEVENYGTSGCYKSFPARHAQCESDVKNCDALENVPLFTHIFALSRKRHVGIWWRWCCEREKGWNVCIEHHVSHDESSTMPPLVFHFHQRWNTEHPS